MDDRTHEEEEDYEDEEDVEYIDKYGKVIIPRARVNYKYRRATDPEFAGAYLNLFIMKILITSLLLLLNNAYMPDPTSTHADICDGIEEKCIYNHSTCPYGMTRVMLPNVNSSQVNQTKYIDLGDCVKPCKAGFQYIGFQKICMEIANTDEAVMELKNCSDIGDEKNAGTVDYDSFTLTVMQISLDHRFFFGKVIATVFGIATLWGISLRYCPKLTFIITIAFECLGAILTGIFLQQQTGRTSVLLLFLGAVVFVLVLMVLLRQYLITAIKYLKCSDQCLQNIPETFAWGFILQLISLAYGVGYIYMIRQSFEILGAENDGKDCKLKPPFVIMIAWAFSGIVYTWGVLSLRQITRGMTSGAVALYYFHNEDFSVRIVSADANISMKWACTKSLGSYFLMGIALPIVEFVRLFQRRTGSLLLLRLLLCGCGKSFAQLVKILDAHATALHAISGLDITNSASVFHQLLNEKGMQKYLHLGENTRKVFHLIAALAGFSTGVVVFVYLLYSYGVLEAIKASNKSLLSVSGFGMTAILFMILAAYFPKASLIVIGFDSAARYGANHGRVGMFIVSMIATSLTSVLAGYMSDIIVQALETLLVCRCLEIHDDRKETPTDTLFHDVVRLDSMSRGLLAAIKWKKTTKYKVAVAATDDIVQDTTHD